MRFRLFFPAVLAVALSACAYTAEGGVIRVGPGESIQSAVNKAMPGDTVRIAGGTYNEDVTVTRSGIVLEGEPGVEIHGQTPWQPKWSPAGFGEGIYKAPYPRDPAFLAYNGLQVLKCTRDQKRILMHGSETRQGKAPGHFKHIRGVWAYMDGCVYLRAPEKDNPADDEVFVADSGAACVMLDGADDVTVRGLTLRYAEFAVQARNGRRLTIEYCTAGPTSHGIRLWTGVHDSTVRYCEVSCPAVFNWVPHEPASQKDGTNLIEDIYYINKPYGPANRRSIALRNSGHNNEIAYNYVHDCYQGIEAKEDRTQGGLDVHRNLEVHHNTVQDTSFYGLCPNGTDINGRWHHNLVVNTRSAGMRIKPPPTKGPLYIYRNVFLHPGGRPWWMSQSAPGPIVVYHNDFVGGWTMIRLPHKDVPNFCLLANAFIGQTRAWRYGRFTDTIPAEQIDYNLLSREEVEFYDEMLARGYQQHGVVAPLPDEADREQIMRAGKDKGPDWTHLAKQLSEKMPSLHTPLPGTEHIRGRADIGAFEEGFLEGPDDVGVSPDRCGAQAFHDKKEMTEADEQGVPND